MNRIFKKGLHLSRALPNESVMKSQKATNEKERGGNEMRNVWLLMTSLAILGLASVMLPMVQAIVPFNATYGGDPGRDEIMFTGDDLMYFAVLRATADQGISILTVDCQYGQGGVAVPITMQQDAHANFQNIAEKTGGVYYLYTTPSWDGAIATEISNRIDAGKGDVVFTFDLSESMFWDTNLIPDLKTKTKGIIDALAGLDVAFGLATHVDYPSFYNSYGYAAAYGSDLVGDYAWLQNLDITPDSATIKNKIDTDIIAGFLGADIPQNYARVVYETQFFTWRPGAEKIVVMYGDAPAHSASGAVGGVVMSVDKLGLLFPYISLASTALFATVATAIYVKRVKRRKEKQ